MDPAELGIQFLAGPTSSLGWRSYWPWLRFSYLGKSLQASPFYGFLGPFDRQTPTNYPTVRPSAPHGFLSPRGNFIGLRASRTKQPKGARLRNAALDGAHGHAGMPGERAAEHPALLKRRDATDN
jgi:hypothetical protein